MTNETSCPSAIRRISPYGKNYFFGYYDITALDSPGKRHLALMPPFIDRLQQGAEEAVVGTFDMSDTREQEFTPIDTTAAWNFQQSAMLQWNPGNPASEVIYNAATSDWFETRVVNLDSGEKRTLSQPVATVAPDGKSALSINFPRLFTYRPGYGYSAHDDPWEGVPIPEDDGIHLVNMETGDARLIVSLANAWEFTQSTEPLEDGEKVLVNHITWNTDGSRFLFLLRTSHNRNGQLLTSVIIANRDGSMTRVLVPFGFASHYWWTGPDTVLFYSDGPDARNQYEFDVTTGEAVVIAPNLFVMDTHMRQLAGTPWVINDTYPRDDEYRRLFLFNRDTSEVVRIASLYSPPEITGDIRCDLHPRFSPDGRIITFDSAHEGFRGIYSVDVARYTVS